MNTEKNNKINELKLKKTNINNEIYIYFLIYGIKSNKGLLIGYNISYIESLFDKREFYNREIIKIKYPIFREFLERD